MRVGRWFIAGLWVFGFVSGWATSTVPALRDLPIPSMIWPVLASFLIDLVLMRLVLADRVEPLTMNERAIGVFGAIAIHILIQALLAP